MTRRRAAQRRIDAKIALITPESSPLAIFGPAPSAAVRDLLTTLGIQLFTESTVREVGPDGIRVSPGDRVIGPAEAIALPVMDGPRIDGLPSDVAGFIPIDEHSRVKGADDVFAAGDGTDFPVKQGGLAAQQADAAAEQIAHGLGAEITPQPFRPVLRGKLLTGGESVNLRADVAGGSGDPEASPDYLWWPPHKIASRYLSPFLYHGESHTEPEPPPDSLDVEVALPKEWHEEPMAIDADPPPQVD
jgi:sulfide:quinone oxidoreductase